MRWYLLVSLLLSGWLFLATPPAAQAVEINKAPSCNLRSTNTAEPAWLTVVNFSNQAVWVYWLNYDGQEVFYRQLQPNEAYVQQTYLTHPWCIRNAGTGQAVYSTTVREKGSLAIIR